MSGNHAERSEASSHRGAGESQHINNAQHEVQNSSRANGDSGRKSFNQIKQNTSELEQRGNLPSINLDGQSAQSTTKQSNNTNDRAEGVQSTNSKSNKESAGQADAQKMLDGFSLDSKDAKQLSGDAGLHSTSLTKERTDSAGRQCDELNKTVADGKIVPSLTVQRAGLPDGEAGVSLSAVPVNNQDKANEQTLVTTAHGFTKLANENKSGYQLLDNGFDKADTNHDGSLSKDELSKVASDAKTAEKPDAKTASLAYQAQFAIDNYEAIADKSKELDPKSNGVTNEGLAQYYMEQASITVNTDGKSIPAQFQSGDRSKDIAVLKATNLSPEDKEAFGKDFEMADHDAKVGDLVTSYGHSGGIDGALLHCHIPDRSEGRVSSDKQKDGLMPGDSQEMKIGVISGASGGPVVDPSHDNNVVGLNHSSLDSGARSYMIPSSVVKDELLKAREKNQH